MSKSKSQWSRTMPSTSGRFWFWGWPYDNGAVSGGPKLEILTVRHRTNPESVFVVGTDFCSHGRMRGLWGPELVVPATPHPAALVDDVVKLWRVAPTPYWAKDHASFAPIDVLAKDSAGALDAAHVPSRHRWEFGATRVVGRDELSIRLRSELAAFTAKRIAAGADYHAARARGEVGAPQMCEMSVAANEVHLRHVVLEFLGGYHLPGGSGLSVRDTRGAGVWYDLALRGAYGRFYNCDLPADVAAACLAAVLESIAKRSPKQLRERSQA